MLCEVDANAPSTSTWSAIQPTLITWERSVFWVLQQADQDLNIHVACPYRAVSAAATEYGNECTGSPPEWQVL
jgi:hypothetical protein